MRVALYHGIVTRLEICASEKHEREIVQRAVNPQSALWCQCRGGRRTGKCSEMQIKTTPLQMLGILFFFTRDTRQKKIVLLVVISGPGLSIFEVLSLL